jgi:hypothetical protein
MVRLPSFAPHQVIVLAAAWPSFLRFQAGAFLTPLSLEEDQVPARQMIQVLPFVYDPFLVLAPGVLGLMDDEPMKATGVWAVDSFDIVHVQRRGERMKVGEGRIHVVLLCRVERMSDSLDYRRSNFLLDLLRRGEGVVNCHDGIGMDGCGVGESVPGGEEVELNDYLDPSLSMQIQRIVGLVTTARINLYCGEC